MNSVYYYFLVSKTRVSALPVTIPCRLWPTSHLEVLHQWSWPQTNCGMPLKVAPESYLAELKASSKIHCQLTPELEGSDTAEISYDVHLLKKSNEIK